MFDKVVLFDGDDKDYILLDAESEIDYGIKNLCDTVNSIEYFVTMNSCQGALYENEKENHCPITYVDFYVLNHKYELANDLFIALSSEFGENLNCTLSFQPDYDIIGDYAVENGNVILRYRIEFVNVNNWIECSKITIEKVTKFIKIYNVERTLGGK